MVCKESEWLIENLQETFLIIIYIFNKTSVIVLYNRIFLLSTWPLDHLTR